MTSAVTRCSEAACILEKNPQRRQPFLEKEPDFKTDRLASGMLHFSSGQSIFICSTPVVTYQRVQVFGLEKRIEVEVPYNAPNIMPCRVSMTVTPVTDVSDSSRTFLFLTGTLDKQKPLNQRYDLDRFTMFPFRMSLPSYESLTLYTEQVNSAEER